MRPADAYYRCLDSGLGNAFGCQGGAVDGLGCGAEFGDQALAHATGLLDAVAAIAQYAVLNLGDQHTDLAAAGVDYGDQIILPRIHRAAPCAGGLLAGACHMPFGCTLAIDFAFHFASFAFVKTG